MKGLGFIAIFLVFVSIQLTAQLYGERPIHVTIRSTSSADWFVEVRSIDKVLLSASMKDTTHHLSLSESKSYSIRCFRQDNGLYEIYYVTPSIVGQRSLEIISTDIDILVSSPTVARYSQALKAYKAKIFETSYFPSKVDFDSRIQKLDSLTVALGSTLCSTTFPEGNCNAILSEVIQPIRAYIANCASRYHTTRAEQSQEIAQTSRLHQLPLNEEVRAMISKVAYGLSLFLARGYDVKSTANLTALRNIVGAECDCESGYGFFTSANSSVGKHFLTCDEDLPRSLLALAGTDSSFFCKTLTRELNKVCATLDLKSIASFTASDRSLVEFVRTLHPDSMYVLHFWGTWCSPCKFNHDDIMLTSDTLELLGAKVLHLALESNNRYSIWQEFVRRVRGEQLLIKNELANPLNIVNVLSVPAFPSYVIIGPNNLIRSRPDWHTQLVPSFRSILAP